MLARQVMLLFALLVLAANVSSVVQQTAVAEAVKWLQLPALASDGDLSAARVKDMMVESHLAQYRIAVEALTQPAGTRRTFITQNGVRLADKVRAHLGKTLAAQAKSLHDTGEAEKLAAAVHSGIRTAQRKVRTTRIHKLIYAPLPPELTTWQVRVRDWWRKWNGISALRDWQAFRLLRKTDFQPQLQTQLEADIERFIAQLRTTIAETNGAAMEAVHIAKAPSAEAPIPSPRGFLLKQMTRKLRKVTN